MKKPIRHPHYGSPLGKLRAEAGFTQDQAARRLKVSAITVSRWERGVCRMTSETRHRLARLYRTTWQAILDAQHGGQP